MEIDINSWHYAVYRHTYSIFGNKPPVNTNLCQYMRSILLLPLWYFYWFFGVIICYTIICAPLSLLFGYYPNYNRGKTTSIWSKYRCPKLFGIELKPWMLLFLGFIIWLHTAALAQHFYFLFKLEGMLISFIVFLSIFVMFGIGSLDIFADWLAAKKDKVCPLITFKE